MARVSPWMLVVDAALCCALSFSQAAADNPQRDNPPAAETSPASNVPQATGPQAASPQTPDTQQAPDTPPSPDGPLVKDTEQVKGPFRVGGVDYKVVLREKMLVPLGAPPGKPTPPAVGNAKFRITLAAVEIDDAAGNIAYQDSFPFGVTEGQFTERVTATPYLFAGRGGSAIVVHYSEEPSSGSAPESEPDSRHESWQVFGLMDGKLVPFGPPLPVGQGEGIAVGGVVAGVMVKNGISVVPLASTADELEFRAWEGHFSIDVPVRVDWMRGEWSQGQECFELGEGSLRPKGCNLRVEGVAQGRGGDTGYVQLFAATDGDARNGQQVPVRPESQVQIVETRAVVNWTAAEGDRIACSFADVWLHVRIDGKDGWVRGDNDFAALGLPASAAPE
jgi:hypothetical protein